LLHFSRDDAAILYAIPKPGADPEKIMRLYAFIQRTSPPDFEVISSCLGKAFEAGIIGRVGQEIVVRDDWYAKIHQFDDSTDNEIEAALEFEEWLKATEWPSVEIERFGLDREEYLAGVVKLKAEWDRTSNQASGRSE